MNNDFEDEEFIKEIGPSIIAMVLKNVSAKKQVNVEKFKRFGIARKAFLELIEQENIIVDGEPTAVLIEEGVDEAFNGAFVRAKFVGITINEDKKKLFETILEYADAFSFDCGTEDGWFFAEIGNNDVFDILE